jgi:hypothetical protein
LPETGAEHTEKIIFFTPNFQSFLPGDWLLAAGLVTELCGFVVAVLANATEGISDQAIGELHAYG